MPYFDRRETSGDSKSLHSSSLRKSPYTHKMNHLPLFFASLSLGTMWLSPLLAQQYRPTREAIPTPAREFRGAWVASVYNIDWPSRKGLSPQSQRGELRRILDLMQASNLNAIIFQVRPHADALYASRIEPWSHWLTGAMGRSPGYDPLAYCIAEAHARGIEVHAWFNPFRALSNASTPTSSNHITRTHPRLIRNFKNYKWMDISQKYARDRALKVILDVVKRYDVDGVHIDDYFYPYPDIDLVTGRPKQIFPDGKTPAQRRSHVDSFVKSMYSQVKRAKPWVRVGISPFGIWRPGVPRGTTARIDAYEHLSADSRKWLAQGWCDYMSPQLYWRDRSEQSFSRLLAWWRSQGKRPVWPGIATSRINSSEDPGRPASEIIHQINLSRSIGRNWVGHVHWSANALTRNRGGVLSALRKYSYASPALVPPMPWLRNKTPPAPRVRATLRGSATQVSWSKVSSARKYVIQSRYGRSWNKMRVVPASNQALILSGSPDTVAVRVVDAYGNMGRPTALAK